MTKCIRWLAGAVLFTVLACSPAGGAHADPGSPTVGSPPAGPVANGQAAAIFAGGCFWCTEKAFEGLDGVLSVTSGYTGGKEDRPTYEQVSAGGTGHFEAVRVVYDPKRISYARLLELFVRNIDPTQGDGQFCDRGRQYRSAIFVHDADQRKQAEAALAKAAAKLGKKLMTQILDERTFFVAEDYHQDFYKTHRERYEAYREACRRDERLETLWGKSPTPSSH